MSLESTMPTQVQSASISPPSDSHASDSHARKRPPSSSASGSVTGGKSQSGPVLPTWQGAPENQGHAFQVAGTQVLAPWSPEAARVLTPEALEFVRDLHRLFGPRRLELLQRRRQRATRFARGERLDFLEETADVRASEWQVAPAPADLDDRRVEITGPAEAKMMINALNSGASVFMADLEDALSPTWANVIGGQIALSDAVRRRLEFVSSDGKDYRLNDRLATLVVRPRGWHLPETHVAVDGEPVSASLFDFGLYFFHNARELIERGSGPYFYLPKIESHLEARLWNDVFIAAQERLGIPRGTVRATVLIETLPAAFEMEEILFELREHAAGLNAGRWDYLFSAIKVYSHDPNVVFPDRAQLTMTVPFMRAYTELLVTTCHRRGAHAIGGMAAFIPSRRDAEVNARALERVRDDKERESRDGFDGTWVAHPDLVPVARRIFDSRLGSEPHQKSRLKERILFESARLLPSAQPGQRVVAGGEITEAGFRANIEVALLYIDSWLQGLGAVAIHNLMEDAATAEISRAELWQWVHHHAVMADGTEINANYFASRLESEYERLASAGTTGQIGRRLQEAAWLLKELVVSPTFPEFLTLGAYKILEESESDPVSHQVSS